MIALSRRSLVTGGAGLLTVVLLGGLGWYWYHAAQGQAMAAYAAATTRLRAAQAPQSKPEDRAAAVKEVEATLARYPSSGGAAEAAYQLASLRFDAGEYAAARGAYQVVLGGHAPETLRTLAQVGIGYAWEGERDYGKAIDAYLSALAGLGPKNFYYEALLEDLGRAQELSGKKADAIATYQRLLKEVPQARRAAEVRARLLVLGGG